MDREKVIEALHCRAYDDDFPCWKCAYYKQDEKPVARCDYRGLMDDAIALLKERDDLGTELTNAVELIHKKNERIKKLEKLLKEQEAVEPILEQDSMVCGVCGHEVIWQKMIGDGIWVDEELEYCPHCGQAVKWE